MVKRIAALLILLLLPLTALAELPVVVDDADLFTAQEEAAIEENAREIIQRYQMDVVVVTSYEPETGRSLAFADDYYDRNGYGVGEDQAGLLYLIDMHNRVPTISTKGAMIDYITDRRLEELFDCSYDALAAGEYGESTLQLLDRLDDFLAQGRQEGSFRYDVETGRRLTGTYNTLTNGELWVAILAGLAVAVGMVAMVTAKYQLRGSTYRFDLSAHTTFHPEVDEERYIRSTVVHRAKPQNPGGHGGMGGGNGSGVHTSSGGSFHGGGSGRGF